MASNFHPDSNLTDYVASLWHSKTAQTTTSWNCGFCGETLSHWDERAKHIAKHFREGKTMDDWKGFEHLSNSQMAPENATESQQHPL